MTQSPGPPGQPEGIRPDPDDTATRPRRILLLGVMSLALSVLAPPVGVLLGGWTLVQVVRAHRARVARRGAVVLATDGLSTSDAFGIVAACLAIAVGTLLTASLIAFRGELSEFGTCRAGANTRVAQDRCQSELEDAVLDRLGL